MASYFPLDPTGQTPGSILGSGFFSGVVAPKQKGILCTVVDPNGHHLSLPEHIYSMNKWGQITPNVTCTQCGWSDQIVLDEQQED